MYASSWEMLLAPSLENVYSIEDAIPRLLQIHWRKYQHRYSCTAKFDVSSGTAASIGRARILIPFGNLELVVELWVHVFDDPSTALILLSYEVLKANRWNVLIPQ